MSPAPTMTGADGGAGDTVTEELPVTPSAEAVMEALPAAAAVTRPEPLTVATWVLSEAQVTGRPMGVPDWSRTVALS